MKAIGNVLKGIGGTALFLLLAYLFYVGGPDLIRTPPDPAAAPVPIGNAAEPGPRQDSYATIVDAVKPAVVNISTTQIVQGRAPRGPDPFREFLERYFGEGMPREEPMQSLGSGLIVEPDGYVLTNNHVIENARMILVRLSDEEEYEARVVGRDPRTDLALLKIQGRREFPVVRLGDSDRLPTRTASGSGSGSWPSATPSGWSRRSRRASSAPRAG
ncbi:MAG: trypsin-like peptidase domain-containing protein [Candidatus Rokubacteria bacterium]|nr:trypsin-like peptidase domain-containing protein [Candidatus Rokubacteria bacterium]